MKRKHSYESILFTNKIGKQLFVHPVSCSIMLVQCVVKETQLRNSGWVSEISNENCLKNQCFGRDENLKLLFVEYSKILRKISLIVISVSNERIFSMQPIQHKNIKLP